MSDRAVSSHNQRVLAEIRAAALIHRIRYGVPPPPIEVLLEAIEEAIDDKREQLLKSTSPETFVTASAQLGRWERARRLNR